jgi:hypothetical protein
MADRGPFTKRRASAPKAAGSLPQKQGFGGEREDRYVLRSNLPPHPLASALIILTLIGKHLSKKKSRLTCVRLVRFLTRGKFQLAPSPGGINFPDSSLQKKSFDSTIKFQ